MAGPRPPAPLQTGVDDQVASEFGKSKHFTNVRQEVIHTTADKVRLVMIGYREALRSRDKWIGPLGISFTLWLGLFTTKTFNSLLGMDEYFWQAFFVIAALAMSGWTIQSIWTAAASWKKGDIENVVKELQGGVTT